ncbi:MAG: HlyD family secretion protein [Flavobacteriaceae bacterium]|jgi:HlyD family secretion protein|nr:HlyD family secretion protein [Flavobacteriaceae bacterium]
MKDLEKIELRSDEVQEILTRPPHVLIRYGISVACGIFLILFAGCFLFKYPDIVIGEAIITTENPPVWLVSKSTGRIKELLCREKQIVNKGDLLAVIDNAANTEDVKLLDSLLNKVIITDSIFHIPIELYAEQYELGNLQSAFSGFTKAVVNYNNFLSINLTNQEITALQKQIAGRKDYSSSLQNQLVLRENELAIAKSTCEREESLYKKGIIAQAEFEVAKQAYLNSQQSLKQLQTSIINENLETVQFKESLKKLTLQYLQNKNQYYSELLSAYRELIASI